MPTSQPITDQDIIVIELSRVEAQAILAAMLRVSERAAIAGHMREATRTGKITVRLLEQLEAQS